MINVCKRCGSSVNEGDPFCVDNLPLRSGGSPVKSLCLADYIKEMKISKFLGVDTDEVADFEINKKAYAH